LRKTGTPACGVSESFGHFGAFLRRIRERPLAMGIGDLPIMLLRHIRIVADPGLGNMAGASSRELDRQQFRFHRA
jgi:hypothetical protein